MLEVYVEDDTGEEIYSTPRIFIEDDYNGNCMIRFTDSEGNKKRYATCDVFTIRTKDGDIDFY